MSTCSRTCGAQNTATIWNILRAYVRYLRKKLEADPGNPQYILTSPGVGYMLTCPS